MSELYDIAILGAGPAGISAAIYAVRGRLKALWLDNQFVEGGQVLNTYEVDNYPGLPGISGMDLGEAMGDHAEKLGKFWLWRMPAVRRSSTQKSMNTGRRLWFWPAVLATVLWIFRGRQSCPAWEFLTVQPVTVPFSKIRGLW